MFKPDGGLWSLSEQIFHLKIKLVSDMTDRVPGELDWQFFVFNEASFRAGTTQEDPVQSQYPNSDHYFTTPVILGEINIWNRFRQRSDPRVHIKI